jgi:sugar O-acyltransferase (sialic acid O-acetyltransferase NeuD family)
MKNKIVLIGGGGHCHASIDVILSTGEYEIVGILDKIERVGESVLGFKVIGSDIDIPELTKKGYFFIITLGQIKSASVRKSIFKVLIANNAKIATIISPLAYVSQFSSLGTGTIIMHRVTIGPNVLIGENSIINTNADIEHDSKIGKHCHISTHCVINGDCRIENEVFIGSNSTVFQGVRVSEKSVIGAGSTISKSIERVGTYFGHNLFKNE